MYHSIKHLNALMAFCVTLFSKSFLNFDSCCDSGNFPQWSSHYFTQIDKWNMNLSSISRIASQNSWVVTKRAKTWRNVSRLPVFKPSFEIRSCWCDYGQNDTLKRREKLWTMFDSKNKHRNDRIDGRVTTICFPVDGHNHMRHSAWG